MLDLGVRAHQQREDQAIGTQGLVRLLHEGDGQPMLSGSFFVHLLGRSAKIRILEHVLLGLRLQACRDGRRDQGRPTHTHFSGYWSVRDMLHFAFNISAIPARINPPNTLT